MVLATLLAIGCGGPEATPEATPTATLSPFGDLLLEITSPAEAELVTDTATLQVSGTTSVDAVVSVDDTFVDVGLDGTFQTAVQLIEGINIIEIVASIATGEQLGQVLTIIYTP